MQTSGNACRENADSYCLTSSTVMPAKAGIQYPVASRLERYPLWNTGSSAFADDDNGEDTQLRNRNGARAAVPHRHIVKST
jgi:hypothetical protein